MSGAGTPSMINTPAVTTTMRATVHYAMHTARLTVTNWGYVLFTVALPVIMYVVFNSLWGSDPVAGAVTYSALIMVQMAAYGALAAAMSGGAVIAMERRSGWFRQLMLTIVPGRGFIVARAFNALILVLPALVLVFAAGLIIGGVRAPVRDWVVSVLLMWVALIPMASLGLVIGVWLRGEAVQGLTTLVMLLLSMAGGLWFPADMMPSGMQQAARCLPSYWLARFGEWPFLGGAFPYPGIVVLAAWTVAAVAAGALGFRRAIALSKR